MSNVINFKGRKPKPDTHVRWMVTANIYQHSTGELDVDMSIEDGFEDYDIFEALVACAYKYAEDNGVVEYEVELEDDMDE